MAVKTNELSAARVAQVLHRAYHTQMAVMIAGTIGIGKSQTVLAVAKELAEENNRKLVIWNDVSREEKIRVMKDPSTFFVFGDVRLSQTDPSDMRGIPKMQSELDACDWMPPMLIKTLSHSDAKGVLFYDEINLAPPSILAACYQIVQDRQSGEYRLNNDVLVCAAGNLTSDRAGVFTMPAPLRDRFMYAEMSKPTINNWTKWAEKNGIDTRVVSFLQFKPSRLYNFDGTDKSGAFSFPTPRSWAKVSSLISPFRVPALSKKKEREETLDTLQILVAAKIGEGVAVEFVAFLDLQADFDLDDFVKNPHKVRVLKDAGPDKKWALISALADNYVFTNKYTVDQLFGVALELEAEFGIMLARLCRMHRNDKFIRDCVKSRNGAFKEFADQYKKYFTPSNIG